MNSAPAFPPPRVAANLDHAFEGVWRLTIRRHLLPARWIAVGLGLAVLLLLSLGSGHPFDLPGHYTGWVIRIYVTFLVPAIAFMSGAGAMRDEMKSGTVDYVLTRPLPRPAFVLFKYCSHLACVQLDLLLTLAVVAGAGLVRHAPGLAAALPQLLFAQVLLAVAFTALGFVAGILTSRYVLIGLGYAGIIEAGVGQIPTQLSRLSMTHQVRELLTPLIERTAALGSLSGWLATTAMLLAFAIVTLGAAATIFTWREFAWPAES
jgi:ABC-2 type transport system permease protein